MRQLSGYIIPIMDNFAPRLEEWDATRCIKYEALRSPFDKLVSLICDAKFLYNMKHTIQNINYLYITAQTGFYYWQDIFYLPNLKHLVLIPIDLNRCFNKTTLKSIKFNIQNPIIDYSSIPSHVNIYDNCSILRTSS